MTDLNREVGELTVGLRELHEDMAALKPLVEGLARESRSNTHNINAVSERLEAAVIPQLDRLESGLKEQAAATNGILKDKDRLINTTSGFLYAAALVVALVTSAPKALWAWARQSGLIP